MRLVGDIGGTKALLALIDEDSRVLLVQQRFACAAYPEFAALLAEFLSATALSAREISGGCLAVAGPLADDRRSARMTNLPWTIDADALSGEFGIGRLTLVNDFAAAALGIAALTPQDKVVLQAGEPIEDGVRLLIGAGTGLGMAVLIPERDGWRVLPGEGGHAGFAPQDDRQAALWAHLHGRRERVEYEDMVSGRGLVEIYRFVVEANADPALLDDVDPAAAIARQAALQPESPARQTLDLFLAIYGAFAGDMALALNARGGVFLAGGVTAKILPLLRSGAFINAFNAKGTHSGLATRMPVLVVTDEDLGIKGAARQDHAESG